MQALTVIATASLMAFAAPALAQSPDQARHPHRTHPPRAGYEIRDQSRYGDGDVYVRPRYGSGDVYVREGRASAPDAVPGFGWRPQSQQEGVGADLVGPGSSAENPTGQHDVSR